MSYNEEKALVCAPDSQPNACFEFDGITHSRTKDTNDIHNLGGIAVYNSTAILISGYNNTNGSTELYEPTTKSWKRVSTYSPKFVLYWSFQAVTLHNITYTFGGIHCKQPIVNDVCTFPVFQRPIHYMEHNALNFEWKIFPQRMLHQRLFASSLVLNNSIIILGGWTNSHGSGHGE